MFILYISLQNFIISSQELTSIDRRTKYNTEDLNTLNEPLLERQFSAPVDLHNLTSQNVPQRVKKTQHLFSTDDTRIKILNNFPNVTTFTSAEELKEDEGLQEWQGDSISVHNDDQAVNNFIINDEYTNLVNKLNQHDRISPNDFKYVLRKFSEVNFKPFSIGNIGALFNLNIDTAIFIKSIPDNWTVDNCVYHYYFIEYEYNLHPFNIKPDFMPISDWNKITEHSNLKRMIHVIKYYIESRLEYIHLQNGIIEKMRDEEILTIMSDFAFHPELLQGEFDFLDVSKFSNCCDCSNKMDIIEGLILLGVVDRVEAWVIEERFDYIDYNLANDAKLFLYRIDHIRRVRADSCAAQKIPLTHCFYMNCLTWCGC